MKRRLGAVFTAQSAELAPGSFALVMATGIVSTAAYLHGLEDVGGVLLVVNVAAYAALLLLTVLRAAAHPARVREDVRSHGRAPAFLTLVAGTAVLGTQFVVLVDEPAVAGVLWVVSAALWLALIYGLFTILTVQESKPRLEEGINGSWMLIVVGTQAVSALGTLLAPRLPDPAPMLGASLGLFLLGCMFYLLLFSLILYRFLFFSFDPVALTPPYWINMGAVAITTLSGSLLILNVTGWDLLGEILPFLKGFTLFFWATATWWIPLLLVLGVWRHVYMRVPLRYDVQYWSIVFPVGMYSVATFRLSQALGWGFPAVVPRLFAYAAFVAWALAMAGMLRKALRPGGG